MRCGHADNAETTARSVVRVRRDSACAVAVTLELARRVPGAPGQATLPELLFGLSVVNPDSVKQVFGETVFLVLFAVALM